MSHNLALGPMSKNRYIFIFFSFLSFPNGNKGGWPSTFTPAQESRQMAAVVMLRVRMLLLVTLPVPMQVGGLVGGVSLSVLPLLVGAASGSHPQEYSA